MRYTHVRHTEEADPERSQSQHTCIIPDGFTALHDEIRSCGMGYDPLNQALSLIDLAAGGLEDC